MVGWAWNGGPAAPDGGDAVAGGGGWDRGGPAANEPGGGPEG